MTTKDAVDGSQSLTLARGIAVLEALSDVGSTLTLRAIAERLGLHRSVVYRFVRTLAAHGLIERMPDNCYQLGLGLVTLARGVATDFRSSVYPVIAPVADALNATVILPVVDGDDLVCVAAVEPRTSTLRVTHREGLRQPVTRGASGIAFHAAYPPRDGESDAIKRARACGYATSNQVIEVGTSAFSVAIRPRHGPCTCVVTALTPTDHKPEAQLAVRLLTTAARKIATIAEASPSIQTGRSWDRSNHS